MRLIHGLRDPIRQQLTTITEFDETLVRRLIRMIAVFAGNLAVEFKSRITSDAGAESKAPAAA